LAALLRNHLLAQGGPCRSATEPGIVPRVQADHNVRVPDLAVTCTPGDGDDGGTLSEPVLVVEILSPSNQAQTWSNVWAYTSIPSVQELLVLHSVSIGAEVLRRGLDGAWPADPSKVKAGDLVLESIGFRAPLADVYRTTRLRPGA